MSSQHVAAKNHSYRWGDKMRDTLQRKMASCVLKKFVKNLFRRKKFKKFTLN